MKQRTQGFLSETNISHESEIFDYIKELHEYLWRFVRVHNKGASGKLSELIDYAVDIAEIRSESRINMIRSLPSQLPKLRKLDRFMENHNGYIAGGCFKNLFLDQPIKDVDIFFNDVTDYEEAVEYYEGDAEYVKVVDHDRFTTFKCNVTGLYIQLIKSFTGEPEDVVGNFDFTITKAYYCKNELGEYEFYCHERFFEHLVNRKLVLDDQILFPASTFNRSYRYTKYGFGLCGESKQKLVHALQGVELPTQQDFYFGID